MKIIFSVIILILAFSCSKKVETNQSDLLIIAGKIENNQSKSIQVISKEFLKAGNYIIKISDDGTFKETIPIYHYHDINLIRDNHLITILNKPSDSVYIHILNKDSVIFTGDNNKTNSDLHLLNNRFSKLYREAQFWKKDEYSPVEIINFVSDFQYKSDSSLLNYSNQIKSNSDATNWIRAKLLYKCTDELFEYGLHNKKDIPDDYFNFLSEYIIQEDDAKFCSEYFSDYASNYFSYQLNSNNKYRDIMDLSKQGKYIDAIEAYFKMISEEKSNLISQINASQMLFWNLEKYPAQVDSLFKKYNSIFTENALKKQLQSSIVNKLNANFKTLDELSKMEEIGEIFQRISLENRNKVLYIDFWGTYCSPCIKEFPNSVKLHNELSNYDIEFVYLCQPAEDATWKSAIEKYSIKGTNILLNIEQNIFIQSLFNMPAIPRYMIVNKKGEIVNENAERPGSVELKNELLKLSMQ